MIITFQRNINSNSKSGICWNIVAFVFLFVCCVVSMNIMLTTAQSFIIVRLYIRYLYHVVHLSLLSSLLCCLLFRTHKFCKIFNCVLRNREWVSWLEGRHVVCYTNKLEYYTIFWGKVTKKRRERERRALTLNC